MRFPLISCGLAMLLSVATWLSAAPEGDPAERLQALVARQRELLAAAERKTSQNELEDLRQPLQDLCFAYEDYLRAFPDQAAGYASYALFLDHPIIDERRRSTAPFLRANKLNPCLFYRFYPAHVLTPVLSVVTREPYNKERVTH